MMKTLLLFTSMLFATIAMGQANSYPNGSTVANFTVTDTDGGTHELYAYTAQGKYVMLEFFFYNCIPCRNHTAFFSELYDTYGCNGADLICISVNTANDADNLVAQFAQEFGGDWHHPPAIGSGGSSTVTSTFGVSATPTFTLISPQNVMINNDIWPVGSAQTFVNAFPAGSNIQPAECLGTGITERQALVQGNVYPSPSAGIITIDAITGLAGRLAIEVIDAMGRIVHSEDLGHRGAGQIIQVMDLGHLNNGNYILRLIQDDVPASVHNILIVH